jgi:hypothetical protein
VNSHRYQVLDLNGKCMMTTQRMRGKDVPCPVTVRHPVVEVGTIIDVMFLGNKVDAKVVVLNSTQAMVLEEAC